MIMKRNVFKYSFGVLALFFAITSCVKEIEYKGENGTPVLVINQLIEADSTFTIEVERSVFFLEGSSTSTKLNNATVLLKNKTNGTSETQSAGTNGMYSFGMIAQEGHQYEVSVSHADYKTASATTVIPSSVPILSVDTLVFTTPEDPLSNTMEATFKWNDPSGADKYILLCKWEGFGYQSNFYMSSNDVSIKNGASELDGEPAGGMFFAIDDETFDGTEKTMKVTFHRPPPGEVDQFEFHLLHVTEEAYKYFISADLGMNAGDDPFTEPVKVFDNINEGLGIFAGINSSVVIK